MIWNIDTFLREVIWNTYVAGRKSIHVLCCTYLRAVANQVANAARISTLAKAILLAR